MKKALKIIPLVFVLFLAVACSNDEEKSITCKLDRNDTVNGYKLHSVYKINYTKNVVNNVETTEEVTSDNKTIIQTFEKTFNDTYSKMNDTYKGYDFNVDTSDNKVVSTVKIDYKKMDLKKLASDEPTMKNIMNDNNEIAVSKAKEMYEQMGATCTED